MLFKTINLDVEVEVDLEEVLSKITTDDLIEELDSRYAEFDSPENREKYHILDKSYHNERDLYEHLCDICDCGYHEPKESLLNKLNNLML